MNSLQRIPTGAWVLACLLVAAIAGVSIVIDDDGHGGRTITVQNDPKPTPAEQQLPVVPAAEDFDAEKPEEKVPGPAELAPSAEAPAKVEDAQEEVVDEQAYDTSRVLEGATAKPARFKCYTSQNGGPRSLSSIGLMVAHVTVSLNVSGYRDGTGLCDFFRRVQASPTWTVDNEGNSWENVPLGRVPWTQAWFNRSSCSIEYVGSTGRQGQGPAQWTDVQLREGGRLFAKCAKLAHIPIRNGRVNGSTGTIIRTGLITHEELGAKGGGHSDPGPFWNRARQLYWIRYYMNPCGATCQKYRPRHRHVHKQLRTRCDTKAERKRRPKECKRLRGRNRYIHALAKKRHFSLKGTYK